MPKLGTTALILSVAGFSAVPVIALTDYIALAGARSGAPTADVAHLLDQLQKQPTVVLGGVVFVIGHILGVLLLGIAAWVLGLVPMWAGLVLAFSQPFHAVFAVAVPNHALDACAWGRDGRGQFRLRPRGVVRGSQERKVIGGHQNRTHPRPRAGAGDLQRPRRHRRQASADGRRRRRRRAGTDHSRRCRPRLARRTKVDQGRRGGPPTVGTERGASLCPPRTPPRPSKARLQPRSC